MMAMTACRRLPFPSSLFFYFVVGLRQIRPDAQAEAELKKQPRKSKCAEIVKADRKSPADLRTR